MPRRNKIERIANVRKLFSRATKLLAFLLTSATYYEVARMTEKEFVDELTAIRDGLKSVVECLTREIERKELEPKI
jgi:hypothetical protein